VRYALLKKTTADGDSYVGVYVAAMTGGSRGDFSETVAGHEGILIEAIEPKPIEQKIVTVTASEIQRKIAADGRAVFYGIYFDFNKADLKPESDPQLAEMAGYLAKNPAAKMFIVGHTDNVGGLDYNMALSLKRAQAVVAALSGKYKIAAARLVARGVGPLSPIAENHDDAGRAKNRRVELVEMGN
jgi:OmpA-OmpF porin, OOP family